MAEPFRIVDVTRVREGTRAADVDRAATEEPLEVRLHGRPFAVIMRTPGSDRDLAAGFLLSERVVKSADELGTIEHCTDVRPPENGRDAAMRENIVNVTLADGVSGAVERMLAERRQVDMNSSCGLCGRLTIESLRADAPAVTAPLVVAGSVLKRLPATLARAQAVFAQTGGLHAAGLFDADGRLDAVAEDVGRHNAVDKVVGRMMMRDALPLSSHVLFVSGRASYEIVQKAFLAGIPIVGSVSAPSSLAIELAAEAGITLVCFVRGESFNIYSHEERIV